jgi:hypothetical protein
MRGAGTADHTADSSQKQGAADPTVEREELRRTMRTCAVSGQDLRFGTADAIVACPYGRLYQKEAAVEALLKRRQGEADALGDHIRGLKDLKEVRFHFTTAADGKGVVPTCPVRGTELNGQIPAVVLLPGGIVNVVSERAFREMGEENILLEYGPAKKRLRLAPTAMQRKELLEEHQGKKKSSSKGEKRKRLLAEESKKEITLGDEIRATVASKVQKSEALASLFKTSKAG